MTDDRSNPGESPPVQRGGCQSQARDALLLLLASLALIALAMATLLLAKLAQVDHIWVLLGWIGLGFFAIVGWDYRREFRRSQFTAFFLTWTVVHCLVFFVVVGSFSWLYYPPAVFGEFFAFYTSAQLLFGLKPPGRR